MPPTALIGSLESVRRRVKLMSIAYGAGVVVAAAVGLLLAVVLLDWTLNLPPAPRLVVMIAAACGFAFAAYEFVFKPLVSRLTIRDVAGRLESTFPQFNDRLRSTVDFLGGTVPGSEFMKNRVVTETTNLASTLDLRRAIVAKPVRYSAGGA